MNCQAPLLKCENEAKVPIFMQGMGIITICKRCEAHLDISKEVMGEHPETLPKNVLMEKIKIASKKIKEYESNR